SDAVRADSAATDRSEHARKTRSQRARRKATRAVVASWCLRWFRGCRCSFGFGREQRKADSARGRARRGLNGGKAHGLGALVAMSEAAQRRDQRERLVERLLRGSWCATGFPHADQDHVVGLLIQELGDCAQYRQ